MIAKGLLFVLKQNHLDMAAAEAKASALGKKWWQSKIQPHEGLIYFPGTRKGRTQLGLTHRVIKVIATCQPNDIAQTLQRINWQIYLRKHSYKILLTNVGKSKLSEKSLAKIIWERQRSSTVDVHNPKHIIEIINTTTTTYVGIRTWENNEDYEGRRAHLRAEMHPSSLHPTLARAMVTLTGVKRIHDPFCGSGGILIEAGLYGKRVSGGDIDAKMVVRARKNCAMFKLHPELRVADATQWIPRTQAIAADLPYGKNTKPTALKPLLEAFLQRAKQSCSKLVLGLPVAVEFPKEWTVRAHITTYVHKSMTKHFYVIER